MKGTRERSKQPLRAIAKLLFTSCLCSMVLGSGLTQPVSPVSWHQWPGHQNGGGCHWGGRRRVGTGSQRGATSHTSHPPRLAATWGRRCPGPASPACRGGPTGQQPALGQSQGSLARHGFLELSPKLFPPPNTETGLKGSTSSRSMWDPGQATALDGWRGGCGQEPWPQCGVRASAAAAGMGRPGPVVSLRPALQPE